MTHPCCSSCRLRFPRPAEEFAHCPVCGTEMIALDAGSVLGFQRYLPNAPEALLAAVALRASADDARK